MWASPSTPFNAFQFFLLLLSHRLQPLFQSAFVIMSSPLMTILLMLNAELTYFHPLVVGAALLVGGLVWRLALEHLGMESVSFGPSSAVVQHGLGYLFKVPDGQIYIDDGLTQNELEVICGLYRCYTGMIVLFSFILSHLMKNLGQGKQEALLSWWPLPNKWFNHVSNGFYWGHWTELDEEWFQIRSSKISQGREQPKRPNKWRNVLKGGKSWRSTVDRHLKAAEDLYN